MELVAWLAGMALFLLACVLAGVAFRDRAERLNRRFHVSEQAARWRYLQRKWQAAPMARLATVQHVYTATPRGSRARIVWTGTHATQDVEIEREQVALGDYLLLAGFEPPGVIGPRNLLARAGNDAPRCAERRR